MRRQLLNKIERFIEIDINYLGIPLRRSSKYTNILLTNLAIFKNIIFRKDNFSTVKFNSLSVQYDTPFATKTFLAAIYDFYVESRKGEIFSNKKPVIIDVGANIGQFLYAVKTFFPSAIVHSVEPDPKIYKILKENSKKIKDVTTYNYAVSSKNGNLTFFVSQDFSEWSSLKKIDGKDYSEIKVDTKTGDTLFKDIKKVDLLKIDVEGAELSVILGMKDILKRCKYVMIEISLDRNDDDPGSSKLIKQMLKSNFYIYHIGRIFSAGKGEEQGAVDIIFKNKKFI